MKPLRKKKSPPELSRLELEVMDVVWDLGDCSSAEVIEQFAKQKRSLAPTTVRTVLANLRKKGYLKPIPTVERRYRMRAIVRRDVVARKTLSGLVGVLFGGSPGQAIIQLLQDQQLDDAELERIRKMIEAQKKGASE